MYPYSVDPNNIPKHLGRKQIEHFILFAVLVAGKTAKQTYKKLNDFLVRNACGPLDLPTLSPFEIIGFLVAEGSLGAELEASRFGQYTRVQRALEQVIKLDTNDLSVEKLEAIPGIGPKTARFIMLYADPSFDGVPLDTHILKFLNSRGYRAPKSTPPAGGVYNWLEAKFKGEAALAGLTVRELDTRVWKSYNEGTLLDLS